MKNKSNIVILFDIDNTLFNTEKLKKSELKTFELYEEVKKTLEKLSKIATLGLFSQGEIAFQNKKLEVTNIKDYFTDEHKHIVKYKIDVIEDTLQRYKGNTKVFFVDDWVDMLRLAKKFDPSIFTIWMKRGQYATMQKSYADFTPDAVVETLTEVVPLVDTNH